MRELQPSVFALLLFAVALLTGGALPARAQDSGGPEQEIVFAQGLYDQENYELAAAKFAAFVTKYPDHANAPLASFRAGECLFDLGRFAQAAPFFSRVTEKFPASAEAEPSWLWLGDACLQAGQYGAAIAAYEGLLAKYPTSENAGRAAYWRAEAYSGLGKHEEAVAAYQDALGRRLEAEQAAYALYAIGWTRVLLNQPDQAVGPLRQVLADHPNSPVAAECQHLIGAALEAQGDLDAALTAYGKVVADYPQSKFAAEAQADIAGLHFQRKAYAQALEAYEMVVARHPDSPSAADAQLRSADCLFRLERWPEAAAGYARSTQDAQGKWAPEALYWLAMALERQAQPDEAIATYQRVATDFADSPRALEALLNVGRLQMTGQRTEAAAAAYQSVLDRATDPAIRQRAEEGLAWARYQAGASDASLAALEQAFRADPKSPRAAELGLRVAQAHFTAERYAQAAEVTDLALEAEAPAASLAGLLYVSASSHDKLGHREAAETGYYRALKETPDSEYAGRVAAALVGLAAAKGDLQQARRMAAELKTSGTDPEVSAYGLYQVAEAFQAAGRSAEAASLYADAAETAPGTDTAAFALLGLGWAKLPGDKAGAAATFRSLAQGAPGSQAAGRVPEGLLSVAEAFFAEQDYVQAEPIYREILTAYPQSEWVDEASYKLGWTLAKRGAPDDAIPLFAAAAATANQPAVAADARYQAGRLMAAKRDFSGALSMLEPFREQHRDAAQTPLALELLGRCAVELGRSDEATAAFGQVIQAYPQDAAAKRALVGQARIFRQKKQLDEAEAALREALGGTPGPASVEAQFELACCVRDRGNLTAAAEEFLKVAILYAVPSWGARAQFEAGQCYEQAGDPVAAVRTYKVIAARYPDEQQLLEQAQSRIRALGQP